MPDDNRVSKGRRRAWSDAEESREAFRDRQVAAIPDGYRPWLHLAGTTLPALGAIALGAASLKKVTPLEWLTVPALFLTANVFEWHAHKNLLHRRWPLFTELYDRHTPIHHRIYRYHSMAMKDPKEYKLVLLPAAAVGGVVLVLAPLSALVAKVGSANAGWLVLATGSAYMLGYELTHFAYHLPKDGAVGRNRLIRWLRELHALHHDPRLMQKYNFNVTVPLADWLLGTIAPKEEVERVRRRVADDMGAEEPESLEDVEAQAVNSAVSATMSSGGRTA